MGVSVAASAQKSGCTVHWASEGRSAATRRRAAEVNLRDVGTLARLCQTCETLISVVPR
jgi:3-hydroxyisobutyrate dehydrogenase-like beta-hydroxyacid dehydrogenase